MDPNPDSLEQRMLAREVASAAAWLGVGVAAAPALDVADTSGLITALASPATFELGPMLRPLALVSLFLALGVGAAVLLRRHQPRARRRFLAACAIPVAAWILYTGPKLVALIAVAGFGLAAARLWSGRSG